jgi:hypothetical protein
MGLDRKRTIVIHHVGSNGNGEPRFTDAHYAAIGDTTWLGSVANAPR